MKVDETQWRRLATRQHGAISHRQLRDAGLSARQVELRVGGGELERVFRGVLRVAGTPRTFEQSLMAACLATGGVASHRAAAALWKLRGCEVGPVELTVANRRRPELPRVIAHVTRSEIESCERGSIPVTTPARTLLDLGAVLPEAQVRPAVEDALHRHLVTEASLESLVKRTGRPGRDGCGVLGKVLASRTVGDPPTESLLEDRLLELLRRAGLPEPHRQYWIRVPGHSPVRVDFAYPDLRLAIEAQSVTWHAGRQGIQRDCDKLNLLVALGWRALLFTWEDVHERPGSVVDVVSNLLMPGTLARRWPSPFSVPSA